MGISGLLPLLKDIQVNRPLSDFAGQTLAVDAYVWLHRGTYGCAPELATGKKTTKYVEYAMHRVRLLQHHGIQPYIVFDGGPLPAKKGTECDRKKRRDENLARANALTAQGRHSQAREYYVKCIDVTPQMAYQLIKALRAEGVPYVVAPYEADAQMAYMERIGLVSGIITEDSDLLVFGCRNVLFKLDAVTSTITYVSRADFASVSAGAAGGISLLGWSDVQFRRMAMLSGCDYLPSIPGVGLKTAWSLLRKHKTVENVVRSLCLEGKKKVPQGYLDAFRMAEKVFLHQRVYDPTQEMLVHLTDLSEVEEWNDETEAYVGADIEPSLAKRVAEGDACPISLLPMEDINPTFVPRTLRTISMNTQAAHTTDKERGRATRKVPEKPATGILSFFTPKSKAIAASNTAQTGQCPAKSNTTAGRSSGKRTLAEVMDQDIAAKRKRQDETHLEARSAELSSSKFFCPASPVLPAGGSRICENRSSFLGPSRSPWDEADKENVPSPHENSEDILMTAPEPVTQEDGYISPSPSMVRWDTPELSSPLRPKASPGWGDDFGADVLSSPPAATKPLPGLLARIAPGRRSDAAADGDGDGRVLVRDTPSPGEAQEEGGELGPDLRHALGGWDWDEVTSDIECPKAAEPPVYSASPSPGPVTPDDSMARGQDEDSAGICDVDAVGAEELVEDEMDPQMIAVRNARVASGWWERWARGGLAAPGGTKKQTPLRRRETTMTADGRQRPLQQARPHSAQSIASSRRKQQDLRSAGRRSLIFTEDVKTAAKGGQLLLPREDSSSRPGSAGTEKKTDDIAAGVAAKNRLAAFRWTGG